MRTSAVGRKRPPRRLAPWQAQRAIQLLTNATSTVCPVARLAEACGLSRSHFAHAFRATTGLPPHKWLLSHRIRLACEMMEQTKQCLAEIAQNCGFADQSHFSRRFRAAMGSSPAVWRRERRARVTDAEQSLAGSANGRARRADSVGDERSGAGNFTSLYHAHFGGDVSAEFI